MWEALDRAREEDEQRGGGGAESLAIEAFTDVGDFVSSLASPRKVLLSIPAGRAVDDTLAVLLPLLSPGDVVIDGGNEHFAITEERAGRLLHDNQIHFVGMGISGGARGARHGPSLMPGGTAHAYALLRPILEAMAARVGSQPMVTHVGLGGAGHFVKTVHNGIEYVMLFLSPLPPHTHTLTFLSKSDAKRPERMRKKRQNDGKLL